MEHGVPFKAVEHHVVVLQKHRDRKISDAKLMRPDETKLPCRASPLGLARSLCQFSVKQHGHMTVSLAGSQHTVLGRNSLPLH